MLKIARRVGQVFGLDLYGVDVLETEEGLMLVDINDFPSFNGVPRKAACIAEYILHAAYRARLEREKRAVRSLSASRKGLQRQEATLVPAELMSQSPTVKRVQMN